MTKKVPKQQPADSKQDYETPREFMNAIGTRFGPLAWDLAAHRGNAKCVHYFDPMHDTLKQDWNALEGTLWLNPPFYDITPFAAKCASYEGRGRVLMLTPMTCADWARFHIFNKPNTRVLFLSPRMSFDGKHNYPKDLMLSIFSRRPEDLALPACSVWRWKP